jgi:hypothetical protein
MSKSEETKIMENAYFVLSSRVELATEVTSLNVDKGLVNGSRDHPVLRSLEELCAFQEALLHDARAIALLSAPSDLLALGVGDAGVGGSRPPKAEVCVTTVIRQMEAVPQREPYRQGR